MIKEEGNGLWREAQAWSQVGRNPKIDLHTLFPCFHVYLSFLHAAVLLNQSGPGDLSRFCVWNVERNTQTQILALEDRVS